MTNRASSSDSSCALLSTASPRALVRIGSQNEAARLWLKGGGATLRRLLILQLAVAFTLGADATLAAHASLGVP